MPRWLAWAGAGGRAAVLLSAVILWSAAETAAWGARTVDYLYVQPNEGDSSGGHVALAFGHEIFHFQHEPPGILRLQRHESPAFYHAYAMLGNRSIRESRIAVSEDTYALLRGAFVRLQLVQDAQLELRDALQRDATLFDLLLRQHRKEHASDQIPLPLAPLGYFLPDAAVHEDPPGAVARTSPALLSLRDRIRADYGDGFMVEKRARAMAALRGLELRAAREPVAALARDAFPPVVATVSTRYQEALRVIFALDLLENAPSLREGGFWAPEGDAFGLEPREASALKKFAAQLETDLVRLAGSPRSDWGFPFLLGMARLAAIEATLATGRLVLLDIYKPGAYLPTRHDTALRPYLPMMEREMRELFLLQRKELSAAEVVREADYAAIERSGNLLLDVERAMATGSRLRGVPREPFPSREARVNVPTPGAPDEATLERELEAARAAARQYQALLDRLYSYDLLRRNCVTELFDVINEAVAKDAGGAGGGAARGDGEARRRSDQRLGGFIDPRLGLAFIPLVSADLVEHSYAVVDSRERPSYRRARLKEMEAREGSFKVFLRECNTITSSVYRRGPADSAFLFFTDDTVVFRPLFGAFNLLAGVGEGVLGLLALPVEGAQRLIAGTRGVLFSLPELLFVNLRKGSMAYVERSPQTSDGPR